MPRKKPIETFVNDRTSSSNPDVVTQIKVSAITPLELDLGRHDLNQLVDKLNELIKKVNN